MAKKQTRRSISVSRTTYERLKAFCESNNISMSQLVENRVNDFLGGDQPPATTPRPAPAPSAPRPMMPSPGPAPTPKTSTAPVAIAPEARPAPVAAAPQQVPMTSAAARFAVEPPPPIIKTKPQQAAPEPTEKRPDQIFTF
jgi:hypothetical protein